MQRKLYSFENFDLDVNSSSMLIIIIGISVGLLIGIAFSLVCRVVSGKVIKALKNAEAVDEDSARTIAELGLSKVCFIKTMLKPDSALYRAVGCVGGFTGESAGGLRKFWHEKFIRDDNPVKFDFGTAKFYLPEEKRISAELRFTEEKHPVRSFVLSAVLITAVCIFAIYAVPELLTMFDNLLTQLSA
ncbi:MAG: hypothetical protein ACI4XJ_00395 [Eubacteriales bacterium]